MPAAPWSVPIEPFSRARRPNSDHTCMTTRSARPRASRSRWNASSDSLVSFSPSGQVVGLVVVGVEVARRRQSGPARIGTPAPSRPANARRRCGNSSPLLGTPTGATIAPRIHPQSQTEPAADGAVRTERQQRPPASKAASPDPACAPPAQPIAPSMRSSIGPQTPRGPEAVVVGAGHGRDRDARGGQRRRKVCLQGQALERVVGRVRRGRASAPASRCARWGRARPS